MNMKRMRGRNQRGGGGGGGGGGTPIRHQTGNTPLNRNHVFDSQGPDLRLRGTSQQLFEKYLQLGRDASSVGDRVMAEGYFQHAEHYFRILGAMQVAQQQAQPQQAPYQGQQGNGNGSQRRPYPQQNQQQDSDEDEPEGDIDGEQPQAERFGAEPREIPITDAPPDREANGRDQGREQGRDSSSRATQDSLPLDRDRMEREPRPQQQAPYEARQDAPQQPRQDAQADLAQPSLQDGQPGHDQQTAPREEPVANTPPPQPRTRTREPRVPRRERPQPTEA